MTIAAPTDRLHRALRSAVCVPTRGYIWVPGPAIDYTPALADAIHGDGRALLRLTTVRHRPAHYVVRIDGGWFVEGDRDAPLDAPTFRAHLDRVLRGLRMQFDSCRTAASVGIQPPPFPAVDDRDGVTWQRMSWPRIPDLELDAHPWSLRHSIVPVWMMQRLAAAGAMRSSSRPRLGNGAGHQEHDSP